MATVFRQAAGDSDAECAVTATELNHRFGCQGQLLGTLEVSGDPGETNRFFSQALDEMIDASIADGRLNNFEAMNCHFAQISPGALPEASYFCDGPLRDPALSLDSDADGVPDELDDFPDDYLGWSDDNGDGMLDPEEMPDADMDGLPDGFELVFGFDPGNSTDALEDADADGISNLIEFTRGTDPLNAASLPPVVNLLTFLRNDSFDPLVNGFRSMIVYAGLRLVGGGTATNVRLIFSSATPIRFEDTVVNEQSLSDCVIAEQSPFGGVFDCGDFSDENILLDIFLYFTPLQSGELDFELTFTADEIETDPSDNTQHLADAVILPDLNTAAADFDADGIVGFGDFFLFVDAFGGTNPLFDLDGSGVVDAADFFVFADHFGGEAHAKLLVLAQEHLGLPTSPSLGQNFPNPFNSATTIPFVLVEPGPVRITLFDLAGQRVAVLAQGPRGRGVHTVQWDGRDEDGRRVASGVYWYRLEAGNRLYTRKLLLLR